MKVGLKYRFFDVLFSSKSQVLSSLAVVLASKTEKIRGFFPDPVFIFMRRLLASLIVPSQSSVIHVRNFEAIVPCSPKDNEIVGHCVAGILENAIGCTSIRIVTPNSNLSFLQQKFSNESRVQVLDESKVLPKQIFEYINTSVPKAIRGWSIQQSLKIHLAQNAASEAVLAVDADTILLKPRVFFYDEQSQLLVGTHEYHVPYREHIRLMWPQIQKLHALSFVPHHQLMQKRVVMEMYGAGHEGILRWLKFGNIAEGSPYSEYESYGQYLISKGQPIEYSIVKWGNSSLSRSHLKGISAQFSLEILKALLPNHLSVSLHSYIP